MKRPQSSIKVPVTEKACIRNIAFSFIPSVFYSQNRSLSLVLYYYPSLMSLLLLYTLDSSVVQDDLFVVFLRETQKSLCLFNSNILHYFEQEILFHSTLLSVLLNSVKETREEITASLFSLN